MGRYYGEQYQPGGRGVSKLSESAPRHTARQGAFPYIAPDEQDKKRQLALKMHKKIVPERFTQGTTAEREIESVQIGNIDLPSFAKKNEIISKVTESQVAVIVGPTGSGKSTQVPQFLLEAGFDNIVLTQPRIMAANGVGERIADELAVSFGEEARSLVAIQTSERFDHQEGARIFVRTDGLEQVLQLERYLARLSPEQAEQVAATTAIVLDEVHESNVNQVGLLALSKRLVGNYPNLHIVVMSATANTEKYVNYFSDVSDQAVPVIEIEGKPAELTWEERPDAGAIHVISELLEDGEKLEPGDDILLFTSGKAEIAMLIKKGMAAGLNIEFSSLHSKMTSLEQARATAEHPDTVRVIVSTDVAMTSLTFPHVKYVIDEGIVKNPELDEEGAEGLVTQICSQAEILQRGGRAGRVRPGVHILVCPHEDTGQPYVSFDKRAEYPVPPIYSTDLSRNVLQFANNDIDFAELDLIDPVSMQAIRAAKDKLYNLGAIDEDDHVTDIGSLMDRFPVSTENSRMIVEAMQPSVPLNVLVNTIIVAASYEAGGLRSFTVKHKKGSEPWRKLTGAVEDDPTLERKLFYAAGLIGDAGEDEFLKRHGYDVKNLMRARKAYRKCMRAIGLDPFTTPVLPPDDEEDQGIRHAVASGLVENIYMRGHTMTRNRQYKYYPSTGFGLPRELSNRSVVDAGSARMVVGTPRFYMAQKKEGWDKVDIMESNQVLTRPELDALDLRETATEVGAVVQGGMVKVIQERRAGDIARGKDVRVPEVGHVDEGFMLKAVLDNPGFAQAELRSIKRTLEQMQNLTKNNIEQIPQVHYENLLLQAIRRSGTTELHEIDAKLGEIMREQGVFMQAYLSAERMEAIRLAAVDSVEVNGELIPVTYRAGTPLAQHVSPYIIETLPDHVSIPDGREVLFRVPKLSKRDGKIVRGHHDVPAHEAKRAVAKAHELLGV